MKIYNGQQNYSYYLHNILNTKMAGELTEQEKEEKKRMEELVYKVQYSNFK